ETVIVVLRQVAALVVEVQLAQRTVDGPPLLSELEPAIGGSTLRGGGLRELPLRAGAAQEGPQRERGGGEREEDDGQELGDRHESDSAISRRMRSRVAASTEGGGHAAGPP